jgi:2-polyprenyl-3-methyl-5-hydroxy-6-metoxy-1,4-benzoquinol methylase
MSQNMARIIMSGSHRNRFSSDIIDKRRIRVKEIEQVLQMVAHKKTSILDVGSGNGAILDYYTQLGYETVGLEVNEELVNKASNQFPETHFMFYDGLHFPLEDSSFDTILLNDVLEHISYEDIEQVMAETYRVLKPDGVVYISVMNRWQVVEPHLLVPFMTWLPKFAWNSIAKRLTGREYLNYWPYTRKRLEPLLERHNFSFNDLTRVYVQHKFQGVNPIGSHMTSRMIRLLRKLRLISIAYYLALKVSILVYLGKKD